MRTREIGEGLENGASLASRLPEAVEKPGVILGMDPYALGALAGQGDYNTLLDGRERHQSSFCDEGTVGQRWAFVQGAMDYQGIVLPNGDLLYLAANEESARRIQRVIWSLGGFASVATGQFSLCNEGGLVAEQRPTWGVCIRHETPHLFFSRPDKVAEAAARCTERSEERRVGKECVST